MRRQALLLLALSPALADGTPPSKPAPLPPPERVTVEIDDPRLKKDIDDCIRRGVNWLKDRQEQSGAWPGLDQGTAYGGAKGPTYDRKTELSALAVLALLKCDVKPTDSAITRGFDWIKKQKGGSLDAYSYAIILMALEAKLAPKEFVGKGGSKAPAPKAAGIPEEDLNWARQLASLIAAKQNAPGGWRYADTPADMEGHKPGLADVSATQYALMGLKTARRMGIPVRIEVFLKASDYLLDQQEKEGKTVTRITERTGKEDEDSDEVDYGKDKCRGWPYMKGNASPHHAKANASMTCAGLVGMLICRAEVLEDKTLKPDERTRRLAAMQQSIYDGLAWLDANWSVTANNPTGDYELGYYLYALERVGVMADLRNIGPKHDWYTQGARIWTERMKEEGKDSGWWALGQARSKVETQDTPYGLLFLRKAAIKIGYPIGEE